MVLVRYIWTFNNLRVFFLRGPTSIKSYLIDNYDERFKVCVGVVFIREMGFCVRFD